MVSRKISCPLGNDHIAFSDVKRSGVLGLNDVRSCAYPSVKDYLAEVTILFGEILIEVTVAPVYRAQDHKNM